MVLLSITASGAARASWTEVSGFSMPESAIAFRNYSIWTGSLLPERLQLPHCTSLAFFARQMHLHAQFIPGPARLAPRAYKPLLEKIFWRFSTSGPSRASERIPIIGYANLYEFTSDFAVELVIKDVLGDSVTDALMFNWNWSPEDAVTASLFQFVREAHESGLRRMIDRNRPAMVYLTDLTATAHAVLLYAYEDRPTRVVYKAYDSNNTGTPVELSFWKHNGKMEHPYWGMRDPWVLHPY